MLNAFPLVVTKIVNNEKKSGLTLCKLWGDFSSEDLVAEKGRILVLACDPVAIIF